MRDEPESLDEQALQEKQKFTGNEPPDYESIEEDRLLELFRQYEEGIPDDDI